MRVGIDVGGTFTDVIIVDGSGGIATAKTLSTANPVDGILDGLTKSGVDPAAVSALVFGSTIATNALVEKKTAPVGVITTDGFRDTLELRRLWRKHLFGSFWDRPEALVPRRFRRTVAGRIDPRGVQTTPLDEAALAREADYLYGKGIRSVAISFLHSHVNPAHEVRAREVIGTRHPDMAVSISSEINPESGEYERLSTTVVVAALKPILDERLSALEAQLRAVGMTGDIHVMKSNGGVMSVATAREKPHELVQSGPSGGVAAARHWGALLGIDNIITLDVGGTTADVSLIRSGRPRLVRRVELEWDIPVRVSLVDIHSVGAGGGSIAAVDAAGAPRLGPRSAGSVPGPACLGRGGTEPTVTDAALLAGWLNGENFAGGEIPLDRSAAVTAVDDAGLPTAFRADRRESAAAGVLELAVNAIAEAIRALTVMHGEDPRDCALFIYGGAGGLFGADVADLLGIEHVVLPANSSVLSAWGGLLSNEEHDYVRSVTMPISRLDVARLTEFAGAMLAQATRDFGDDGRPFELEYALDLRYEGQSHELTVPIGAQLSSDVVTSAAKDFERLHRVHYGHVRPEDDVEIAALRLHASRPLTSDAAVLTAAPEPGERLDAGTRTVYRYLASPAEWPVRERGSVGVGHSESGPLIVEDATSTLITPLGWRIRMGTYAEIQLKKEAARL